MTLLARLARSYLARRGFSVTPKTGSRAAGFAGAQINNLFNDWVVGRGASKNSKLQRSLETMRSRSRQLCEDDDYAKKFVSLVKTNIAGANGVKTNMDVLDPNGLPDTGANDMIETAFAKWGSADNCTVTRDVTWRGLQHLLLETLPQDGEILLRLVRGFDNPFGFALQPLPVDCIDTNYTATLTNGNTVRMGVERDQWKRRVAFHVLTDDPTDLWSASSYSAKRERLPASDIIHAFIPTSVHQLRGYPWFHTAMTRLQMLSGYEEASLVAARGAACQSGFFEHVSDPNLPAPAFEGDATDEQGNPIQEMEPGVYRTLPKGMKFAPHNPAYPHTEHSQFSKQTLRGIASGLLVSYTSLSGDLEGVNYSSIRAGLLEERETWMLLQMWFIDQVIFPIFTNWLKMTIGSKELPLPVAKFEKFLAPKFNGRRWPWVDPLKDIEARVVGINNKLDTRTATMAEQGEDFEEDILRVFQKEEKLAKKYGVDLTPPNPNGTPPSDPNAKPESKSAPAPAPRAARRPVKIHFGHGPSGNITAATLEYKNEEEDNGQ